jgi:hypothetical protein
MRNLFFRFNNIFKVLLNQLFLSVVFLRIQILMLKSALDFELFLNLVE